MKTLILLMIILSLSACGGGGSATGSSSSTPISAGGSGHVYQLAVTGQDNDFNFAPVINGPNQQANPGPQTVLLGQTKVYTITDSQANVQITGIGDGENNNAYYVSVVVYKDGSPVTSANVGVGVSENWNF